MRLFHYALIPVLDNKHLIAEWRECIGIKRQWEKIYNKFKDKYDLWNGGE